MVRIDPGLANIHAAGGVTKISFISGHETGALVQRFGEISAMCSALDPTMRYRTGAVSRDLSVLLTSHGFAVANELTLMERDLNGLGEMQFDRVEHSWKVSGWRLGTASRIDFAAFPLGWSLTIDELAFASRATNQCGLCFTRAGARKVGFSLVGLAGNESFLQRLAVRPSFQGHGFGAALTAASLRWAAERGAGKMFVNTETDNHSALRLYERFGFQVRGERLVVMEKAAREG
jgi:ribosomal protein S18 acetylase RimI-like enzyme